ncbi:hypothetical protein ACVBEF_00755 [Glaciimonas sp. GG7]
MHKIPIDRLKNILLRGRGNAAPKPGEYDKNKKEISEFFIRNQHPPKKSVDFSQETGQLAVHHA